MLFGPTARSLWSWVLKILKPLPHDPQLQPFFAHRQALLQYASALTRDTAQAEDLVQEAFLRFAPALRGGAHGLANPVAYLYRIVRNLAVDQIRQRSGEQRQEQDPAAWMVPQPQPSPEQAVIHRQDIETVSGTLQDMPEKMRIALEMRRFGGHTLEQIASRLQVSVPTAHRLVRDAMLRIAAALDDEGAEGE